MIRFVFLTALATILATPVFAQSNSIEFRNSHLRSSITPFVTLGSYEFASGSGDEALKPTQRFGIGVNKAFYAQNEVTLEAGLEYLPVGTRLKTSGPGFRSSAIVDLDYLAVPLNAKKFFRDDLTGFYLKGAIIPAYLMNAKSEIDSHGAGFVNFDIAKTINVEDSYKKFDVQGALGVGGVFIANTVNRIFLDFTWGRSLAPISKGGDIRVYNEGFLFTSGFTL